MQKLDHSPADTVFPAIRFIHASPPLDSGSDTSRRLLVVVSDTDIDPSAAARRILEVADVFKSPILFLGLCGDKTQEPGLHRQLITLSAMLRDEHVPFEIKVESGKDWLDNVRSHWREGDVLVCFSGQRAGTRRIQLGPLLQSNFRSTVYVLDTGVQPERAPSNWASTSLAWTGSIGILSGFLWLQIRIEQASSSWVGTAMLALSIFVEICLVWIWNSLFE